MTTNKIDHIPPTNRTANPRDVKQWHKEWINGELFADIPTDGIVCKINSATTKKRLCANSKCLNLA